MRNLKSIDNFGKNQPLNKDKSAKHQSTRLGQNLIAGILLRILRVSVIIKADSLSVMNSGTCIVVCNHVSLLDGVILSLASPIPLSFAVERAWAVDNHISALGLALLAKCGFGSVVPMDSHSPFGLRSLLCALKNVRCQVLCETWQRHERSYGATG